MRFHPAYYLPMGVSTPGLATALILPRQSNANSNSSATTHCGTDLCTWWHESGEINTNTAVAPENVRESYTTDGSGELVGFKARNVLVIFASAFLPDEIVPLLDGPDTKVMTPVRSPFQIPGAHRFGIQRHIGSIWRLGLFVTGAVKYTTSNKDFYATGYGGVLSGETYFSQVNTKAGYKAEKSGLTSLRL
ncbi:hypothetical protein BJY00DRAFT_317815 [Aspergillus carlsbadensis]|nr:hypothetical protein BJY00DRAFT_317815 [Aspergillus carlsbadensis]